MELGSLKGDKEVMDEYGCLTICEEDASYVRAILENFGAAVFALNISEGTMFNFCITKRFEKLGMISNGGSPMGRIYVAVQGIGACHFAPRKTYPDYFSEKLNMGSAEAEGLSTFWNLIWKDAE